jgi:flavin-dependent dehydrogenase
VRSAIVIGGGPAGSVAAILLSRGGWRVTLVEQHRFPRDKVCGECLSALGADVLRRLGLFDELLGRGAVRLDRTLLNAPSGVSVAAPLPRPMWGISRVALDGLLLDAAVGAGARVLQPARCEAVQPGTHPAARVRDMVSNEVSWVVSDAVLIADGKSALFPDGPPPPTTDLGIKTHFENVDGRRDAIELFGLPASYAGLAPIEGGRWNFALSVPAARARAHNGNLTRLVAELIEENPALYRRLARSHQLGGWVASPLPRFAVRTAWPQGVIPVGNAAAAIEPIGGEGMGLAIRSAQLAAQSLTGTAGGRQSILPDGYRRLWRARFVACRVAALAASSRSVADGLCRLLAGAPGAIRPALSLIGK